ncbi:hypothetical protein PFISCL1PPCAC_6165 [Pristionchus fissidentatus]|uniref:Uncharacterized protein n=1 Tax=Pristionchus fissidentatus TaxID=1538716 RepID=A0AAV5V6U8_9BILA|nr:hypothetical protein PFISCL1PPCAC_6165 [Pristionchus fissidentatus]
MRGILGVLLLSFVSSLDAFSIVDPCAGLKEVLEVSSILKKKERNVDELLFRGELSLKVYQSEGLVFEWMWFRSVQVMGLDSNTVEDVLTMLDLAGCSFIPWGDSVWKSIRRLRPSSMEGEVHCQLYQLESECGRRFGWNACTLVPSLNSSSGISYLQIGRHEDEVEAGAIVADPIRVYPRDTMWKIPSDRLMFTVDSLAIIDNLDGKIYVMDVSGRGVYDACERNLYADTSVEADSPDDLLRYFELRSFDFRPADEELRGIIESELRNGSMAIDGVDLREWYCENGDLLNGISDEVGAERELCWTENLNSNMKKRIAAAEEAMKIDTPYLWKEIMEPAISSIQYVPLTPEEFSYKKYGETKRQRILMKEEKKVADGRVIESETEESTSENGVKPVQGPLLDYDIESSIAPFSPFNYILISLSLIYRL